MQLPDFHFGTEPSNFSLLLAVLLNLILSIYREQRQRKWQLADEARKSQELKDHEAVMKQELAAQTEQLQKSMRSRITDLGSRLDSLLDEEAENERRRQGRRYPERDRTDDEPEAQPGGSGPSGRD